MKVLLNILKGTPPTLSKNDKWDQSFRDFVNSCLQKDPTKRPTIDDLFKNHKKFLSKAKDAAFLKKNFLGELKEVYLRKDPGLDAQAQDYLAKKNKTKIKNGKNKNEDTFWDFGGESEDAPVK